MPNVAAIFNLQNRDFDIEGTLRRVANSLDVEGVSYTRSVWCDPQFGLTNLLPAWQSESNQFAVSNDGNKILCLDGEVYNLESIGSDVSLQHGADPNISRSAAQRILQLLDKNGPSYVSEFDGQFNILLYDRRAASLTILNDRWGYRPLYFYTGDGLFICSVERKAILGCLGRTLQLDQLALLELFTFGHHLQNRTLFEGISVLPQGAMLKVSRDTMQSAQYWRPAYPGRASAVKLNDCAHELGRRLIEATRIRTAGPRKKGIFLSGGLDSRAVAGALAKSTTDVTAFTFGSPTSPDVRFGRQLAQTLGFRHRHLIYPQDCYATSLSRVVWRIEGAVPYDNCISIEHHRHMCDEIELTFNGHFGDALTGGHIMPQQFWARSRQQLVEHILKKRSYLQLPQLRRVFRSEFLSEYYPQMCEAVARVLKGFDEDRSPLLYNLWDLTQRQHRFTFCSPAVDRYLFEQVTPFVSKDVTDWCLNIPLRFLVGQRAYKRAILFTFPEIAHVPWARTSRPVPSSFTSDMAYQVSGFLWRRLRKYIPIPESSSRKRASRPSNGATGVYHPRLRQVLDGFMASDLFPSAVLDQHLATELLEGHFARGENQWRLVADFLTLAESFALFFSAPVGDPPDAVQPELSLAEQAAGM